MRGILLVGFVWLHADRWFGIGYEVELLALAVCRLCRRIDPLLVIDGHLFIFYLGFLFRYDTRGAYAIHFLMNIYFIKGKFRNKQS